MNQIKDTTARAGSTQKRKNATSARKNAQNVILDFYLLSLHPSKCWNCFSIFAENSEINWTFDIYKNHLIIFKSRIIIFRNHINNCSNHINFLNIILLWNQLQRNLIRSNKNNFKPLSVRISLRGGNKSRSRIKKKKKTNTEKTTI